MPLPPNNDPVFVVAPGALQMTAQVSCATAQVFSGAGALHDTTLARLHLNPASLSYNADIGVTAMYRTGLQNINDHQNVVLRLISGVTSVYAAGYGFPVGGSTTNMQPQTQIAGFFNTANNSCYVELTWDVASGANSFTIDQITLKADVYRRRRGQTA